MHFGQFFDPQKFACQGIKMSLFLIWKKRWVKSAYKIKAAIFPFTDNFNYSIFLKIFRSQTTIFRLTDD